MITMMHEVNIIPAGSTSQGGCWSGWKCSSLNPTTGTVTLVCGAHPQHSALSSGGVLLRGDDATLDSIQWTANPNPFFPGDSEYYIVPWKARDPECWRGLWKIMNVLLLAPPAIASLVALHSCRDILVLSWNGTTSSLNEYHSPDARPNK